jgi:opacity protein-like surface antigen
MRSRFVIALCALGASAQPVAAQWSLGIGGGATFPLGRFEESSSIGWHGLATIGWSTLMQPIGVRVDAHHHRFTAKVGGPGQAVTSATLNLSYRLPMTNSPLSPYIIGGGGAYRFECTGGTDCGSDTRIGWNAGLGTKFASLGLRGFVEARWQAVNSDGGNARFVPLSLGLTF